ncbi:putative tyrosinase-like protein tyr-3 [Aphelenchoides bicaudatus]|nr:putative tyrosinase-like protein tyr-3 [Aphelenchoides bicaudatus]
MYVYLTVFALIPISTVHGACSDLPIEGDGRLLCDMYSKNHDKTEAQFRITTDPQYDEFGGPGEHGFGCESKSVTDECETLVCFCQDFVDIVDTQNGECVLPDGEKLAKAIRKEYRTLTDEERQSFHNAMWKLKQNGDFDDIAKFYKKHATGSASHNGPGFLPWHREFLKRVEFALRRVDHKVAIPFWDSTMDSLLPNPRDSIIWTNEFMGSANGEVKSGPFAGWTTTEGGKLKRKVGAHGKAISSTDREKYLSNNDIDRAFGLISAHENESCSYRVNGLEMEYLVGYVHQFVGGDMEDIEAAANDPIFYLLHSFADQTWETWRFKHQNRSQRESQYPVSRPECFLEYHNYDKVEEQDDSEKVCYDFNIKTALSNSYTDNLYEYRLSPHCPNCGNSPYLFCHPCANKCASKIRPGGDCTSLENTNACYKSTCYNGKCVIRNKVKPALLSTQSKYSFIV